MQGGITIINTVDSSLSTTRQLMRLMQLSSASLPVGGYSFSQALEYAIDSAWLKNADDVAEWVRLCLHDSIARVDLPLLIRLQQEAGEQNETKVKYWNATVLACRETHELLLTETAMGDALARLMPKLDVPFLLSAKDKPSFIAGFASCAAHWHIPSELTLQGYLWSWVENQIAAATKLVPLGQTQAQQLLITLTDEAEQTIEAAKNISDDEIGSSLPGLAMASSWHETQYSRLFRS